MSMPKKFADHAIRIEPAEVFDNAIVGISKDKVLIYSHSRIIQILMEQNEFTDAERPQFRVTYAARYAFKSCKRIKEIVKGVRDFHPKFQ